MRTTCALAALLTLSACAGQPEPVEPSTPCPEPRPQVCTMQYDPACAILFSGERKEYASPCNACADDAVSAYLTGPCPE